MFHGIGSLVFISFHRVLVEEELQESERDTASKTTEFSSSSSVVSYPRGYAKHLADQSDDLKKSHRDKLRHLAERKQQEEAQKDDEFAMSDVTSDSDESVAAADLDEIPCGQVLPGDVLPVPEEPEIQDIDPNSGLPFRYIRSRQLWCMTVV